MILSKIKTLKKESQKLSDKIDSIKNEIKKDKIELLNIDVIESLLDKCSIIDKLKRLEQKQIIDVLVDVIYYHGPTEDNPKSNLDIKFIGGIKPLKLQNSSPSTCNVNQTTTFRKVFEDIHVSDDLYKLLPEKTLAEKIKKIRKSTGLTQREFAKKCDVGYTSLCKYECGYNISKLNKQKICAACNIDASYLE